MKLIDQTPESLTDYVVRQISAIAPDGSEKVMRQIISRHMAEALERTGHCIDRVAMWRPGEFNYLHSSQYCQFLYYLANTIWRNERDAQAPTRLFLLNKALNAIDLFYEIEMPPVFFIGHSVGIVLAKATYGNYLVLYQNSTVGRHLDRIPSLGEGVILYPNTAVIGGSVLEDGVVVSQGTSVIDSHAPARSLVFPAQPGKLSFRPAPTTLLSEYFRL